MRREMIVSDGVRGLRDLFMKGMILSDEFINVCPFKHTHIHTPSSLSTELIIFTVLSQQRTSSSLGL